MPFTSLIIHFHADMSLRGGLIEEHEFSGSSGGEDAEPPSGTSDSDSEPDLDEQGQDSLESQSPSNDEVSKSDSEPAHSGTRQFRRLHRETHLL